MKGFSAAKCLPRQFPGALSRINQSVVLKRMSFSLDLSPLPGDGGRAAGCMGCLSGHPNGSSFYSHPKGSSLFSQV